MSTVCPVDTQESLQSRHFQYYFKVSSDTQGKLSRESLKNRKENHVLLVYNGISRKGGMGDYQWKVRQDHGRLCLVSGACGSAV